jgi:Ca2+-transporting ATPase
MIDEDSCGRCCYAGAAFSNLEGPEALEVADDLLVMSRARPADKLRMVRLLQDRDEVVAVTGDGTNDAPALNRAHVGLSLGSGTSVAKQASDITLLDDSFLSIVKAVMWGRSLYKNIQRFIFFQLVVNVAALLLVLAGSFMGTELPLTVTQILWVNLIMDTFAAMALASLPPTKDVMSEQPRRASDFIITRHMWQAIAFAGTLFAVLMAIYLFYIERSGGGITVEELTEFFTTFVMLQWWNLLNARALGSCHSAFRDLLHCRGMLVVMAVILAGQWLIVTFGGQMFRTQPLSVTTWTTIIAATSPVLLVGEVITAFRRYLIRKNDE